MPSGLAAGIRFLLTIATHARAGRLADRAGLGQVMRRGIVPVSASGLAFGIGVAGAAFHDIADGTTGPLAGLLTAFGGCGRVFVLGAAASLPGVVPVAWLRMRADGRDVTAHAASSHEAITRADTARTRTSPAPP